MRTEAQFRGHKVANCQSGALVALVTWLLCSSLSGGIQPVWVVHSNGGVALGTNQVVRMALDMDGNAVIAASSTSPQGDYDYLVLKYGSDGGLRWSARYASTNGNDQVRDMALDNAGDVYVTGTSVTVKYGSSGTLEWTAPFAGRSVAASLEDAVYVTGFSETDYATVKLSARGSNEWVRLTDFFEKGYLDHSEKVMVSQAGDVYVAGGGVFFNDPPLAVYRKAGLIKYSSTGTISWRKQITDRENFPAGPFYEIVDVRESSGFIYTCARTDNSDFYVRRFLPDGTMDSAWAPFINVGGGDGATGFAVHSDTAIYATGSKVLNQNPNLTYATFGISGAGTLSWQGLYNNGGLPYDHRAKAVALDGEGNVYVTGLSNNEQGDADWATIKYTPDGREQWVRRYAGAAGGRDEARAIAVNAAGEVFVAGTERMASGAEEIVLIKYAELTAIQVQPNQHVALQFFVPAGETRRLQATSAFPDWQDLATLLASPEGIVRYEDTNAPAYPHRFYRLVP
jgi:hypothetical protein